MTEKLIEFRLIVSGAWSVLYWNVSIDPEFKRRQDPSKCYTWRHHPEQIVTHYLCYK